MKKSPLRQSGNPASNCPRLSVRLSDGQICTLLAAVDICINERARLFTAQDLRALVELHRVFRRKLGDGTSDYIIRDGYICNARRPDEIIARAGRRQFSRPQLALSNG